jgi:hypothetical protein
LEEQSVPIELAEARITCARVLALRSERMEARRLLEKVRASAQGTEARMLVTVADEMLADFDKGTIPPALTRDL